MRSLWTDLLFLHGYITDFRLAQRLSNPQPQEQRKADRRRPLRRALFTWPARLCLGIGDGSVRTQ
jgi:hypothetical protein